MILTIDIGNSNTSLAVFKGDRIVRRDRLETGSCRSVAVLSRMLSGKLGKRVKGISGIAIASVVPGVDSIFREACERKFSIKPLFVTHKNAGVNVFGNRPGQAGADRLANIAEAYARYNRAVIVVDFGTATTLDVVTSEGEFIGGAIAPGIDLASQCVVECGSKAPSR